MLNRFSANFFMAKRFFGHAEPVNRITCMLLTIQVTFADMIELWLVTVIKSVAGKFLHALAAACTRI